MAKKSYLYSSPIGELTIVVEDELLKGLHFGDEPDGERVEEVEGLIKETVAALNAYFAGELKEFTLPLSPEGTDFQQRTWQSLCDIPYGETRSYKEVAEMAGSPKAARAVGMANNRNPIAIIIPCHRVVGADGKLVGFGGGLDKKEFLLELERKNANP